MVSCPKVPFSCNRSCKGADVKYLSKHSTQSSKEGTVSDSLITMAPPMPRSWCFIATFVVCPWYLVGFLVEHSTKPICENKIFEPRWVWFTTNVLPQLRVTGERNHLLIQGAYFRSWNKQSSLPDFLQQTPHFPKLVIRSLVLEVIRYVQHVSNL